MKLQPRRIDVSVERGAGGPDTTGVELVRIRVCGVHGRLGPPPPNSDGYPTPLHKGGLHAHPGAPEYRGVLGHLFF